MSNKKVITGMLSLVYHIQGTKTFAYLQDYPTFCAQGDSLKEAIDKVVRYAKLVMDFDDVLVLPFGWQLGENWITSNGETFIIKTKTE